MGVAGMGALKDKFCGDGDRGTDETLPLRLDIRPLALGSGGRTSGGGSRKGIVAENGWTRGGVATKVNGCDEVSDGCDVFKPRTPGISPKGVMLRGGCSPGTRGTWYETTDTGVPCLEIGSFGGRPLFTDKADRVLIAGLETLLG